MALPKVRKVRGLWAEPLWDCGVGRGEGEDHRPSACLKDHGEGSGSCRAADTGGLKGSHGFSALSRESQKGTDSR